MHLTLVRGGQQSRRSGTHKRHPVAIEVAHYNRSRIIPAELEVLRLLEAPIPLPNSTETSSEPLLATARSCIDVRFLDGGIARLHESIVLTGGHLRLCEIPLCLGFLPLSFGEPWLQSLRSAVLEVKGRRFPLSRDE